QALTTPGLTRPSGAQRAARLPSTPGSRPYFAYSAPTVGEKYIAAGMELRRAETALMLFVRWGSMESSYGRRPRWYMGRCRRGRGGLGHWSPLPPTEPANTPITPTAPHS